MPVEGQYNVEGLFTCWPRENVWMPDPDHLIDAARRHYVRFGAVIERVHAFRYRHTSDVTGRATNNWMTLKTNKQINKQTNKQNY